MECIEFGGEDVYMRLKKLVRVGEPRQDGCGG